MKELNLCDNSVFKDNCTAAEVYYGENDNIVDCDSYIEILVYEFQTKM